MTDGVDFSGGAVAADSPTSLAFEGPLRHAFRRLQKRLAPYRGTGRPVLIRLAEDAQIPSEGFLLRVGHEGVTISAGDQRGCRHGLHALARLVQAGSGVVAPQSLEDSPVLAVRGLVVDAGRRYWQPETLRQLLDEMAWRGLNRLQLHLTEWNAFRIALADSRFADLAAPDSYPAEELNALIDRAHDDGIEVSVELNLPGHCTRLIAARPELQVPPEDSVLRDGSLWTGFATDGWMVDVTAAATRTLCGDLLRALVSEVHADAYHLGGDEWFSEDQLKRSPGLVRRAAELTTEHHAEQPYSAADVVVDFLNEMCEIVQEGGGRAELWSWWSEAGARQVQPSKHVTITAWGADVDPARLTADGYRVIASPEDTHYVTPRTAPGNLPGINYVAVDCGRLASDPLHSPVGEQLCIWTDWAEDQPDDYFIWYALRPLQVFADRVWTGPHADSSHVDHVALAADSTSNLRFSRVVPGRELKLDTRERLAGVRINPVRGAVVESASGKWSNRTRSMLDRWRGAHIEIADASGSWRAVRRLDLQLSPTWVTVPLHCPPAFAGRVRWDSDGHQPPDDQVEWLVASNPEREAR